jgi:hypothetical protein
LALAVLLGSQPPNQTIQSDFGETAALGRFFCVYLIDHVAVHESDCGP